MIILRIEYEFALFIRLDRYLKWRGNCFSVLNNGMIDKKNAGNGLWQLLFLISPPPLSLSTPPSCSVRIPPCPSCPVLAPSLLLLLCASHPYFSLRPSFWSTLLDTQFVIHRRRLLIRLQLIISSICCPIRIKYTTVYVDCNCKNQFQIVIDLHFKRQLTKKKKKNNPDQNQARMKQQQLEN